MFNSNEDRKSIPTKWCGTWQDKNGKKVIIESATKDLYSISFLDERGLPFKIKLLNDKVRLTNELVGQFLKGNYGNPILQIEAGSEGVGPTYNLYFLYNEEKPRLAKNTDSINLIFIKPNVGIGLYDDDEDDLGVPWAFPLENFKKLEEENN